MSPRLLRLPPRTQRPTSSPLTYRDNLLFAPPPLPSPAAPPTASEIAALDAAVSEPSVAELKPGEGAYMGADWATRGDWVGRYGSRYAMLCAAGSPLNHEIVNDGDYKISASLGPDCRPNEGVRHWIQWLHTDDPRVLWDPVIGARREAEWDDHGETYSKDVEGPDLWVAVTVPAGVHRLNAYFVNKDGHAAYNRWRDYIVELRPWRADVRDSQQLKALATARVREFWGGVYENFAVVGPGQFYLHVSRNNSGCCAILSSVMLDKLLGPRTVFETKHPGIHSVFLPGKDYVAYTAPPHRSANSVRPPDGVVELWYGLTRAAKSRLAVAVITADRTLCYRALAATPAASPALLAWWRRSLPMATAEDRAAFTSAMAAIYADELKAVPVLKRKDL